MGNVIHKLGFVRLLMLLAIVFVVLLAVGVRNASACRGGGGAVVPFSAAVYAPQFAPVCAPQLAPVYIPQAAPVYIPQAAPVYAQAQVQFAPAYAPAVQFAPRRAYAYANVGLAPAVVAPRLPLRVIPRIRINRQLKAAAQFQAGVAAAQLGY